MAWAEGQRERWETDGAHRVPPGWTQARLLLCCPELACVEAFSVGCCQSNSRRFHIKLWIDGFSRKLRALVSSTQTPARPQLASSEHQYRPFTFLTRDQWAVLCSIVCAPLSCLCFFFNREEESKILSISVSLLKMGKQELHRGSPRSPGCPGRSHSCLPGGDSHCGSPGGSELRKTLPSSSRALGRKEGMESGQMGAGSEPQRQWGGGWDGISVTPWWRHLIWGPREGLQGLDSGFPCLQTCRAEAESGPWGGLRLNLAGASWPGSARTVLGQDPG